MIGGLEDHLIDPLPGTQDLGCGLGTGELVVTGAHHERGPVVEACRGNLGGLGCGIGRESERGSDQGPTGDGEVIASGGDESSEGVAHEPQSALRMLLVEHPGGGCEIGAFALAVVVTARGRTGTPEVHAQRPHPDRPQGLPDRGHDGTVPIPAVERVGMGHDRAEWGIGGSDPITDEFDAVGGGQHHGFDLHESDGTVRCVSVDDKLPIKMLNDRLLVRIPDNDPERRSTGGILIPATAQLSKRLVWAEVVALGQNVRAAEVGDKVLFNPEDRYEVEVQGVDYVMLRERDLHAVAAERIDGHTGLYL